MVGCWGNHNLHDIHVSKLAAKIAASFFLEGSLRNKIIEVVNLFLLNKRIPAQQE